HFGRSQAGIKLYGCELRNCGLIFLSNRAVAKNAIARFCCFFHGKLREESQQMVCNRTASFETKKSVDCRCTQQHGNQRSF
ncbi:MAG: hypothetical protein RR075_03715, partial [Pygmaiobacter sp.]